MGCVSSYFRIHDFEDYTYTTTSANSPFFKLHISLFRISQTHSLPSSVQPTIVSFTFFSSYDNFMSNTFHSTPRPLPYDADPEYFRSHRDSLVSRRDKGSSYSHEEAEPLASDANESFSMEESKWPNKLIISSEDSEQQFLKSTRRILKPKTVASDNESLCIMSNDEDMCPTFLEGDGVH